MTNSVDDSRLRPAGRATRDAIEAAARELFSERGFDDVSVRTIAAQAGIDPALVIRHFGSKEELFLHVVQASEGIQEVLQGPLDGIGRRLVAYFLGDEGEQFRNALIPLTRASHHPKIGEELRKRSKSLFVDPLTERLEGDNREIRVMLAGAQMNGLLNALFVQQKPELVAADRDYIIEAYGDAMQGLLTP